ncbi:putative phd finger domain-containing protein [Neofusicoccum parvum UCRNP2]|uniref:Phd finger domain-containing protein n=2 Tax=Neofusicoccum parvum TaxID=310453 RepID=A0ACB5RY51_9PEZI|nr:putative phd finger domain-containing protein [Neofusicoccum parvum UCRNP2]GME25444.1 phd finger domain-containing protein [Neofusicoccum parvum]
MPARKRARQEVEQDEHPPPQEPTKLEKLRNTWEFASLTQYIYIFGSVVKIDEDIDVDELESECLKPHPSEKLAQIGLALLKFVSSHKGLTLEIFDEYARRQFVAKAPQRNPFGVDEEPIKFNEMDTFTKLRILQQLSTWTLNNADRIREKMPEQKDVEQTNWRVEAFGWDKEDRTYFVLDDDRLYRRTDPPLPTAPPPKSKSKPKPKKAKGTRASKRRRLSTTPPESGAEDEDEVAQDNSAHEDDTFGGMKWECVAVALEDYQSFISSIRKSRDINEKNLVKRLESDVMPIIEKRAEQQRQKALRKQRELENLEKMANAKRSSRIAGRVEKQKEQEAAEEAERKRIADLDMAKKEQEKQQQMEEARQSRMMTREQRLKEREVKRILHEEELKRLEENSKKAETNEARMSERHLKAEMERRQKELEQMAQEEENWIFDCAVCGVHGENLVCSFCFEVCSRD